MSVEIRRVEGKGDSWVGPDLSRPRLEPESEALLANVRVDHYEALEFEDDDAPPPSRA